MGGRAGEWAGTGKIMTNILITGAGSGIGQASAVRMAKSGHVIVADRNNAGAAETVSRIEAAGGTATAIPGDVSDGASVKAMKARIHADIGPVHKAFFAAGIYLRGLPGPISQDDWGTQVRIHGHGPLLGLPWQWGGTLGFVLAAVSPAVVVPGMLSLQACAPPPTRPHTRHASA
mgnify:CR=1 FL=1